MRGNLVIERWLPLLLGALALLGAHQAGFSLPANAKTEILSATISVGAIFAGFLGTAKAILMALPTSGLPARLRQSGYMDDLARYMAEALAGGLVLCVTSIVGLFPIESWAPVAFGAVWAGVAAHSVVAFWRVSRIMLAILRLGPENV